MSRHRWTYGLVAVLVATLGILPAPASPAAAAGAGSRPVHVDVRELANKTTAHPREQRKTQHALPRPATHGAKAKAAPQSPKAPTSGPRSATPKLVQPVTLAPAAPTVTAGSITAFTIDGTYFSEPATYTSPGSTITATYDGNAVLMWASSTYDVRLAAPLGQALAVGTYTGAVPSWQQTGGLPGIDTDICFGYTGGSFTVEEASFGPSNEVLAFAATYHIQCDATRELVGELRYQSTIGFEAIDFYYAAFNFPAQHLATTSPPVTLTVSNVGTLPVAMGSASLQGSTAFAVSGDTCGGTSLAVGAQCSISVTFSPSAWTWSYATLHWTDDTPAGGHDVGTMGAALTTLVVSRTGSGSGTVTGALDCGATCTVDLSPAPSIALQAQASAGSVFAGWGGACSGRDACAIPASAVTPTVTVSASFAPILLGGSPLAQSNGGFPAYRDGEFGCPFNPCLEPPDPAVAVSTTQVVVATNATVRITDRAGHLLADVYEPDFFAETAWSTSEVIGGDPRVAWDPVHGRWIASEFSSSCSQGHLYVAVSDTSDAAGGWLVYRWSTPAGTLGDFPVLGSSSDKIVLGYNAFGLAAGACDVTGFISSDLLVAPLAGVLAGNAVSVQTIVDTDTFGYVPATDLSRSDIVLVGGDLAVPLTDPALMFRSLIGAAPAAHLGPRSALRGASLLDDPPALASFPNASAPVLDGRVTMAAVSGGRLWLASTTSCMPSGAASARACARVGSVAIGGGFAAFMDNTQNVPPGVNTAQTAVASLTVAPGNASIDFRIDAQPPYGLSTYGANGGIYYGAAGATGPRMFALPCPTGTGSCSPDDGTWRGTLLASDFIASPQVPTFAAAVAAMQAGHAYVQVYDGDAPEIRGQLAPATVTTDRYQESVIGAATADTFLPAVGIAGDGTAFVTFSRATGSGPISTAMTWSGPGDVLGSFHAQAWLTVGTATYKGGRWGDYATIVRDPADTHAVWQAHETVTASGDWSTWVSQLHANSSGAPNGTITLNGGATSTVIPDVKVVLAAAAGSGTTEALVSDSPTTASGLLAKARRLPIGTHLLWSLTDAAVGGAKTTGTKTVYVQWGNGVATWSTVRSVSITLTAPPAVQRLWGADRYAAAAAISAATFAPEVSLAFIATGLNYPDALAGAAVGGRLRVPILLVGSSGIPSATAVELTRLKPDRIVILGGPGSVPDATATALAAYAKGGVYRIWGPDRYSAAAAIADTFFAPGVPAAYIATGLNFPDALAGAPVAGKVGGPILLVSTAIPASTAAELAYLKPKKIVILGGPGSVSTAIESGLHAYTSGTVTRLWGADRYAAAAAISAANFAARVDVAFIATGLNFPDALAGGPVATKLGGPILLVTTTAIPAATATELTRLQPRRIVVLGGPGSVSDTVKAALAKYVVP